MSPAARSQPQHLFVYGTLMSGARNPAAFALHRYGRRVGPASIAGKLFHLGAYPGAVAGDDDSDRVHGELYRLAAPRPLLALLDRYEGCGTSDPEPHLFFRRLVLARLTNGRRVDAWVYFCNLPAGRGRAIPSGRYAP